MKVSQDVTLRIEWNPRVFTGGWREVLATSYIAPYKLSEDRSINGVTLVKVAPLVEEKARTVEPDSLICEEWGHE